MRSTPVKTRAIRTVWLAAPEGECVLDDFPSLDETVTLEWQQSSQNFVITDVE